MQIAYDAAPLLQSPTGIGHYTLTLLEQILALRPEIQVVLWALSMAGDTERIPSDQRLQLKHMRIPARIVVLMWERIGRPKAEKLFGQADVVHGTNFWVPPLQSRKGVVTIHDLTFRLYPEMCTPPVQRYEWIVPKVLRRCRLVITPSETVRSQVAQELRFPLDDIVVTPEGVRGSFIGAKRDAAVAQRLGVEGEYVLFAGTQEPRKNLDRLIQAFASVRSDLKLLIAGPSGWGSINLPALTRKLHLNDRVIFSGYLADGELASLMAGCRAFVFPTIYEGFGLPPLEAMAAGVPVVSSTGGSLPEILGDAPFYCDPFDVASIAGATEEATKEGEARNSAVRRGIEQASKYSWEETARLTLHAYDRVASSH